MARILVVDDVKEIRVLVKLILANAGHDVVIADDAMMAMEKLNCQRFDLGIFDIEMPYTNGFQLSKNLRESLRYKLFPIIFLTARKEKKDIERAIELNIESYILKPIQKEKLLEAVGKALKQGNANQDINLKISDDILPTQSLVSRKSAVTIKEISELGFVVLTTEPFEDEEILHLDSPFFALAGIPNMPLQVNSQRKNDSDQWESLLAFHDLNYEIMVKIRAWINQQILRKSV